MPDRWSTPERVEPKPSPMVLWYQAHGEHPDDADARGRRYVELLREHGHVVMRDPADRSPLFPCGYDPRARR